jgi:aminocarboxymuconate-semialdehyde decarboxylase
LIIDFHAHLYPQPFMNVVADSEGRYPIGVRTRPDGTRCLWFEGIEYWTYAPAFHDVGMRLREMDAAGVERQVLSLGPPMVYWAEPELGLRLCRIWNDAVAAVARAHPDRFVVLAALPLQDAALAVGELDRCASDLGMRGAAMGTNIAGRQLDDRALWPVYERLHALDLPIFLHPISPCGYGEIHAYRIDAAVYYPFETTVAAARMVLGGVLEAFPRLDVCLAHLGGAIPYLRDRLDLIWQAQRRSHPQPGGLPKPPSQYIARFYLDNIAYSETAFSDAPLLCALACVGSDRIVVGSDAPFASGDLARSVEFIRRCHLLTEADREKILGGNAARLLRLPPREPRRG